MMVEMGLHKMEKNHRAKAKAEGDTKAEQHIHYSIYAPMCSDVELVRKHLDTGALEHLIKEREAKLLEAAPKYDFFDPCYAYVLLGACAMTLGCQLPESYLAMLKKVYTEGGLMPDAVQQMRKALFGPTKYQNGVPYDFESKNLEETANSKESPPPNGMPWVGLNVIGPGGFWDTGMGDSKTSVVIKELRNKHNNPDACGGCGAREGHDGNKLMQCGRCRARKYCSEKCQRKSWKAHKRICDPITE